jgi:hypothetical protein
MNAPISPVVVVNRIFTGVGQNPDVIINDSGIVTVVWEQSIDSRIQIGLVRFDYAGNEIESPRLLKDDRSLADQLPRIALGMDGRFVVVWQAMQDGIQGQLFSNKGKKIGNAIHVSKKNSVNPHYPSVKIDNRNRIAVVWQEGSMDDFRIVLRVFDWQLRHSRILQVDNAKGLAYFSNPELLFIGNGNLTVAWKDYRTGEANIFQQIFNATLRPVGSNFRVNDDTGSQWQRLPRLAGTEGSNYAIVWEDYRNSENNQIGDIYLQLFNKSGKRIGKNCRVELMNEPTSQRFPASAMGYGGELVVTWSDVRANIPEIYMATFTSEGQQKGVEIQLFP